MHYDNETSKRISNNSVQSRSMRQKFIDVLNSTSPQACGCLWGRKSKQKTKA